MQNSKSRREKGLASLVEVQVRDTMIVSHVASHQRQVMLNCGCSNVQIRIGNEQPSRAQIAANTSKSSSNETSQAKYRCITNKLSKSSHMGVLVLAVVNTF